MRIQNITNGLATAILTPDDCRLLAQACEEALVNVVDAQQESDIAHTETLGAAFKAIAIAGYAQFERHVADLTLLAKRLKAVGW
jgi:hypothetical protein